MEGTIVSYSSDEGSGVINARDGKAYSFALADWPHAAMPPEVGIVVAFEIAGTAAANIRAIGRAILLK